MELHKLVNGVKTPLTQDEIDDFNAREAAHLSFLSAQQATLYRELRKDLYNSEGVTDSARLDALWELLVEDRPEAVQALQLKRENIKAMVPKPGV